MTGRRVKIHVESAVSSTRRQQEILHKAAKKTLANIPTKIFKAHIKKGPSYTLEISLISPAAIKTLNAKYRHKNKVTDVLSFSRLESLSPFPEVGDVLICLARAKKQARDIGCSLEEELARLTVHGVLHLFGYDHETNDRDAKRMFRLQEKILNRL
jgi:probable rRNA maturation factor